jgi:PGF-pre-PGF domain-containing protein
MKMKANFLNSRICVLLTALLILGMITSTVYALDGQLGYGGYAGRVYSDKGYAGKVYSDNGYSDRGYSNRGPSDRGYSDRGYSDKDYSDRGYPNNRYLGNKNSNAENSHIVNPTNVSLNTENPDRGPSDRGYPDRGYPDRVYPDRVYPDRVYPDREYSDKGYLDRGYPNNRYLDNKNSNAENSHIVNPTNVSLNTENSRNKDSNIFNLNTNDLRTDNLSAGDLSIRNSTNIHSGIVNSSTINSIKVNSSIGNSQTANSIKGYSNILNSNTGNSGTYNSSTANSSTLNSNIWELHTANSDIVNLSILNSSYGDGGGDGVSNYSSSPGMSLVSREPEGNVVAKELATRNVISGNHIMYDFPGNSTCILFIEYDAEKTFLKTTTTVEELKSKSVFIPKLPLGIIYKQVNIQIGDKGVELSPSLKNGLIGFRVKKAWIHDKNVNESMIVLQRYNKNWEPLYTEKVGEDTDYIYFRSKTSGFSSFAITEYPGEVTKNGAQAESKLKDTLRSQEKTGEIAISGSSNNNRAKQAREVAKILMAISLPLILAGYFVVRKKL